MKRNPRNEAGSGERIEESLPTETTAIDEMPPTAMRAVYLVIASIALVIGLLGIPLPLLPATPFLLIAAWAASRGSRRFHDWIFAQPLLARLIRDWHDQRAVPLYAKWLATLMMCGSISLLIWREAHWGIVFGMLVICTATAIFLWTRPNPRRE